MSTIGDAVTPVRGRYTKFKIANTGTRLLSIFLKVPIPVPAGTKISSYQTNTGIYYWYEAKFVPGDTIYQFGQFFDTSTSPYTGALAWYPPSTH